METWKQIPGYGGHYRASSLGRIKSLPRIVRKRHQHGKIMSQKYGEQILFPQKPDRDGYFHVHLSVDGVKINRTVHRLVLEAFTGPRPDGMESCHNNSNPTDNRPENLRWDTHANNNGDRLRRGNYATGENHPMSKLSDRCVATIYRSGLSAKEIVLKYRISKTQAHRIINGNHGALR